MNNYEKIAKLFNTNKGYITRKEIDSNQIPSTILTDFVRKNHLVKITKGFYASHNWIIDDYFVFQYKYPKYIYSYQSALFLHDLSDRIPFQKEVTRYEGYNPRTVKGNEIIHKVKKTIYPIGISEVITMFGNSVRVYDPERTIIDLIKDRKKQDTEIFIKAIQRYNKSKQRNLNRLMEYAETMKMKEEVYKLFEVIAYED